MLDVLLLIVPILLPILAGVLVVRTGLLSRADSHVLIWICSRLWPGPMLGKL